LNIPKRDLDDLRYAKALLENPSLATRITNLLGVPVEKSFDALPQKWSEKVYSISRASLSKALDFALLTVADKPMRKSFDAAHKGAAAATGAAGGAFGFLTLPVELPVSTMIMLRSIAAIARSEGERLGLTETKLSCLSVFALGGTSTADDAAETGYFAVRTVLARAVSDATRYIAERGAVERGAPALVRFITAVAARFSLVVSDKIIAQAIPVVGAAGGGLVNTVFMDHFQDMAHGHFIVRRLERSHGAVTIRTLYESI